MVRRASVWPAWDKALVFVLALLPATGLLLATLGDGLGANPAQALVRATGDWSLRALCLVLAVTPLRVWLQQPLLARWRRMLGLFVFFYASLHLLSYGWFDMGLVLDDIVRDISKRRFILVGFVAYLALLLLALTSCKLAVRSLGGQNWQRLHRLVYGVAVLALLHFFWMRAAKNDVREVAVYASIIGALLAWRVLRWWRRSAL